MEKRRRRRREAALGLKGEEERDQTGWPTSNDRAEVYISDVGCIRGRCRTRQRAVYRFAVFIR